MNGMLQFLAHINNIKRMSEANQREYFDNIINKYKKLPKRERRPYYKTSVKSMDEFSIARIVWTPDGRTMPHKHGGSEALIRVLYGGLTQELFAIWEEDYEILERNEYSAWEEIEESPETVHRIGNKSSRQWAVSLHLFDPRLDSMEVYNLEDNWRCIVRGDSDTVLTFRPKNAVPIWSG